MRPSSSVFSLVLLASAGCATSPGPHDPARFQQTVSLVNSLSWTNAMSGKPDAMRTSWPLAALSAPGGHTENFPLAQVKQCDPAGTTCSWGVVNARRVVAMARFVEGGVALELLVAVDVDRHQEVRRADQNMAMSIPADVSALRATRAVRQALVLEYGKVHHIDFDFGIAFDLCLRRLDADRQPVDECEMPVI